MADIGDLSARCGRPTRGLTLLPNVSKTDTKTSNTESYLLQNGTCSSSIIRKIDACTNTWQNKEWENHMTLCWFVSFLLLNFIYCRYLIYGNYICSTYFFLHFVESLLSGFSIFCRIVS